MTVSKREAQATLDASDHLSPAQRKVFQSLIDAMPPDPETRAERLGRVCREAYAASSSIALAAIDGTNPHWIAAAAAVAEECKPREVTAEWLKKRIHMSLDTDCANLINAYVRGEDA